jgi:hypothetical protein
VKVDNVVAEQPGTTAFDVTVTNGNASTTTTYRLLPTGANVPFPTGVSPVFAGVPPQTTPPGEAPRPTGVPPGLYLARVASPGAVAFTPPFPGLVMARFPLDLGSSFDAAASDGATSMSWRSTVKAKATVDACGTPLDAYQIELANGRSTTANGAENVTFTSTLMMGTQYGGLLLAQSTSAIGTQGAVGVSRDVSITLDQEPQT